MYTRPEVVVFSPPACLVYCEHFGCLRSSACGEYMPNKSEFPKWIRSSLSFYYYYLIHMNLYLIDYLYVYVKYSSGVKLL